MDIKEYMLPGVKSLFLNSLPDERGFFMESWRADWKDFVGEDSLVQVNASFTYPGLIRAWHRHDRGQVDYFLVLEGALKICAFDDREESPNTKGALVEIIASSQRRQIIRVPGIYWHGFKNIYHQPSLLVYFVNRLYDYANPDEERRPWNDPEIINPNNMQPFDWNADPNK